MYVARAAYVLVLLILMSTAWLVLTGTQIVRDVGDLARFGTTLFQILAPLQLALVLFFSAMLAASAVAQEKDRKTLLLLLLTNLSNSELVLGKLLASLLQVLVMLLAAVPLFMFMTLFGGVSFVQIARVFLVTVVSVIACGSLGSVLALWREKTFQALAMTVLLLVLWLAVWQIVATGVLGEAWFGISTTTLAHAFSPWLAVLEATRPYMQSQASPVGAVGGLFRGVESFLIAGVFVSAILNGLAIALVRVWNPSRESRRMTREDETWKRDTIWGAEHDAAQEAARSGTESTGERVQQTPSAAAAVASRSVHAENTARTRHVWDNPIIWREIRTKAYGRKMLIIRLAYLILFALAAMTAYGMVQGGVTAQANLAAALVPLFLLSLVLVNAQAVTSLTSERDAKALDLLLVSDLTPKEFVFGKLGGVFYNTKEMVVLPVLLCVYIWLAGAMTVGPFCYLIGGLAALYVFVAMVGVHTGMNYVNSRTAISTSLGTVFFLFVGVSTCMWMMVAFSGSFQAQLQPFLAFMLGGGVGLYIGLGARNPSRAIGVAAFLCPLATFYAITSMLLGQPHLVFIATVGAYGFTTIAMLIPAIDEFDVATGRTTMDE